MDTQSYGSIVAFQFRRPPSVGFADIVEEFDIAFQMVDSQRRALTWDNDDIALIDRDGVRVGLGWLPGLEKGEPSHLIVAVGAPPEVGDDTKAKAKTSATAGSRAGRSRRVDPRCYRYIADRVAERTRGYLPFTALLHGEAHQPVSAELIDATFSLLRLDPGAMAGDSTARGSGRGRRAGTGDADGHAGQTHPFSVNHIRNLLLTHSEPSEPIRLTIHTLALSIALYAPPLGAAMFTYTMLRDIFPMASQAV